MTARLARSLAIPLVTSIVVACNAAPAAPAATGGADATVAASAAPASVAAATAVPRSPAPAPTLAPGVTSVVELPFRASGILAVGDVIWAEDHASSQRAFAVDPKTGEALVDVQLERPCDLAAGFDRVWFADLDAGSLVGLDPVSGKVIDQFSGLTGPCGPQVAGEFLWVAVDGGIARVDPKTGKSTVTSTGDATFPGSGTPLWAVKFSSGDLVPVDMESGKVGNELPPPGGPSDFNSVGAGFGALWVANGFSSKLHRLDSKTGAVEAEIKATYPTRLLVGADAIWTSSYETGIVERIDPTTNEVVYRVKIGGNPNGITEGMGSIWVADTASGKLYGFDPAATGIAE